MEYMKLIVFALLVVFIVQRILPARGVRQLSASEVKAILKDSSKQFVDVRIPAEYKANHIKGFQNIPLHTLAQLADNKLSKDKEVIVICQSGMRSQKACRILKKKGYTNVANVRGGISAWS
ncbi:Rhodanese domain-containing protein [Bacillus freudenreichii]|nr:Rhodanese domain-containing protein [Bacillus freudenreichii]